MTAAPRVLVIRRRYLGDIVLLGALLRNLRLSWPKAHLAVLVEKPYADVVRLNPDANATLLLPKKASDLKGWSALLKALRSSHFTHVLDLDNTSKTAVLTRLTGAKKRIALLHELPTRMPRFYTDQVIDPPALHENRSISEYYLQSLLPLGIAVQSQETRFHLQTPDLLAARTLLEALPYPLRGPRVMVHPGSRSVFRLWPADRFAEIIDRAQTQLSAQVILIGGPADQKTVLEIQRQCKQPPLVIQDPLPVGQFAALASLCDLLLCHDSGPMHVAAAVGTPVVALLGSQNPALFAPAGEGHTVLQAPQPCRDCVAPAECVQGDSYHNYCVRRISVEDVWKALTQRLNPTAISLSPSLSQ